jgi:beta-lactamase regulating signal transducer with metallopeptidase domain
MDYFKYILISSVCLSLFYALYRLILKHERNFRHLRIYLLASVILSLLMPLNPLEIPIHFFTKPTKPVNQWIDESKLEESIPVKPLPIAPKVKTDWTKILVFGYVAVALVLLLRFLVQFLSIFTLIFKSSEKLKNNGYSIVFTDRFQNSFSFFKWVFISKTHTDAEELKQIILHEKIHASQYHSADLALIELVAAVMWFNPVVWMVRKSIKLVHEYLADEGVLDTGIDKLKYQALLINQAAEERLICLSSSFNHSLIKKRMIMMTKRNCKRSTKVRILTLIPASVVLFIAISCANGIFSPPASAAVPDFQFGNTGKSQSVVVIPDTAKKVKITAKRKTNAGKDSLQIRVVGYANQDVLAGNKQIIYILNGKKVENLDHIPSDSFASVNVIKDDNTIIARTKGFTPQKKRENIVVTDEPFSGKHPLFVVDGIKKPKDFEFSAIDPNKIESISVLKGDAAKALYPEDSDDGVLIITTKK